MENKWIKTDDYQFVKKIEERKFDIINIMKHPDKGYLSVQDEVHLDDFTDNDLDNIVRSYGYSDYEDLTKIYGNGTDQVMAEIISEVDFFKYKLGNHETKEEVNNWLKEVSAELKIA